jgi:hydroxyacylglutathione hydrolase
MYVEQLYTGCLAEAAYYIESDGEAAIIDPIRETTPYLALAEKRGAKIKYIFETHFHADFVSGHIDLANETGALIIFGPNANPEYPVHVAKDEEIFELGKVSFKVIHTPGHTMESTCYLLRDENQKDYALFSGDTLFVVDVGRPDLAVKGENPLTQEQLAATLFDSLNQKIVPLADEVMLYPAHGPGSSCGKNLGSETWSTLGEQKLTNYALAIKDKELFIKEVCDGLLPPPAYFFEDASINRKGYSSLDGVLKKSNIPFSVADVQQAMKTGALILDSRNSDDFENGFIAGSVNMGLNGSFALWAGTLLDIQMPLVIIAAEGKEMETIMRLARVGYENVKGFLQGGIETWKNAGLPLEIIRSINAEDFMAEMAKGIPVVDVRKVSEAETGMVAGALNLPLAEINERFKQLDPNQTYLIHCAGGYRSMVATSLLRRMGIKNLVNVRGGIAKMRAANVPLVVLEKQ